MLTAFAMSGAMHTSDPDPQATAALAAALARLDDASTVRRFLGEILTPAELHDLALRWRLLERLCAGQSQRAIADDLGVSLCKITRGSRVLKQPGSVTAGLLRRAAAPTPVKES